MFLHFIVIPYHLFCCCFSSHPEKKTLLYTMCVYIHDIWPLVYSCGHSIFHYIVLLESSFHYKKGGIVFLHLVVLSDVRSTLICARLSFGLDISRYYGECLGFHGSETLSATHPCTLTDVQSNLLQISAILCYGLVP